MNRLQTIGNITSDAEVKDVNGKKAINFSLATNEKYKDANGTIVEKTYYYGCTIWRESNVNISEYLTKGTKVFVEGKPDVEVYKDKNGDVKGAIKINVSNIELLGGGSKKETQTSTSNNNTKKDDDDLPF
jgi:single-strand DNA-binding protein